MPEYVPGPYDGTNIEGYLREELARISEQIQLLADSPMDIRHVAPEKPRNGLYYADGTDWDPGAGKGVYRYDEDTSGYVKLG